MRNLIYFFITLFCFSCASQNVIPIYNSPMETPENPYFKDIDNDYNKFEGTWKWQYNNTSLNIEFKKMIKVDEGILFHDRLIGEYKFIENGSVLVNTLPLIPNFNNPEAHNLWGGNITTLNKNFPPCPECQPNSRHIKLYLDDPTRPGLTGMIIMTHFTENGYEKIRMRITTIDNANTHIGYTGPDEITIPYGDYTLVKQ